MGVQSTVRVHVVTPIVTECFRETTPPAPDGCTVTVGKIANGPASIESAVDEALAAPGVIDAAIRAEQDGAHAVVIDCMLDPGLDAARESVSIPVVGCGEAAMRGAGKAFSIVTVLQKQERAFFDLARKYGLGEHLVSVRGIGIPVLSLDTESDTATEAAIRESRTAVAEGASAIVFGCTGMLGFGEPVSIALDGPTVIDPLPNAIACACRIVAEGDLGGNDHQYPAPTPKRVEGFQAWEALHEMMRGGTL